MDKDGVICVTCSNCGGNFGYPTLGACPHCSHELTYEQELHIIEGNKEK